MTLTDHFTIEELTRSQTAHDKGIDNTLPAELLPNLTVLAHGLEHVRAILNAPLHINSGYRCLALNTAVNGSKTSAHMEAYAADFTCPQFGTPLEIVRAIIRAGVKFDQCIQEGNWVHISFDPRMRQRVMTAHFDAVGKPTYTGGIS